MSTQIPGKPSGALPPSIERAIRSFDDFHRREMEMKATADKGKIRIGGGAIKIIKTKPPAVTDSGKIRIGAGNVKIIKTKPVVADSGKIGIGGGNITLIKKK